MACFLVSAAAALGVSAAKHIVKHNENKHQNLKVEPVKFGSDTKWSDKLKYLELTLYSGSFMLAGEHVIHGEVTPFPPFLTAASSAEGTAEMLQEMGTVGVAMLATLVLAWAIGVFALDFIKFKKRNKKTVSVENK